MKHNLASVRRAISAAGRSLHVRREPSDQYRTSCSSPAASRPDAPDGGSGIPDRHFIRTTCAAVRWSGTTDGRRRAGGPHPSSGVSLAAAQIIPFYLPELIVAKAVATTLRSRPAGRLGGLGRVHLLGGDRPLGGRDAGGARRAGLTRPGAAASAGHRLELPRARSGVRLRRPGRQAARVHQVHNAVVAAAGPGTLGAAAVPLEHLPRGPAVQLHQVSPVTAAIQPRVAEVLAAAAQDSRRAHAADRLACPRPEGRPAPGHQSSSCS
jgi:hypothetical protein